MSELEQEVFNAMRRLLIIWVDYTLTGQDTAELLEETKYITGYRDFSSSTSYDNP